MPIAGHVALLTGLVAELRAWGQAVLVFTGSRYRDPFEEPGAEVETWSPGSTSPSWTPRPRTAALAG
jgi:hypothetical protein